MSDFLIAWALLLAGAAMLVGTFILASSYPMPSLVAITLVATAWIAWEATRDE